MENRILKSFLLKQDKGRANNLFVLAKSKLRFKAILKHWRPLEMTGPTARKRGRRGSPESWSVDAHVGQRVRMRRTLLGMSQEKLGEAIGLTFQQVQKYERGSNRISAGTLYRLGQVLDVPVSFFFDCYDDPDHPRTSSGREDTSSINDSQISRREARLLRLWRAAPSHVSDELLSLLSSLSPGIREQQDSGDSVTSRPDLSAPSNDATFKSVNSSEDGRSTGKDAPARATSRHARIDTPPRLKPAADGANGKDGAKPRRRHGAVWDPTDIMRASKIPPRE